MALNVHKIDKEAYGKRLREMRLKNDVKQGDIAEYLNCKREYVSAVETAKAPQPSMNILIGVKNYFMKMHGDNKPYDWWIDGINLSVDQVNIKNQNEKLETMANTLKDKEKMIALLEDQIEFLKGKPAEN